MRAGYLAWEKYEFMRIASGLLVLALSLPSCLSAHSKEPQIVTEKIEWTWADQPEHPTKGLPNILLMGDSITRAYYSETAKELDGIANVYLFATSCSSGDPRLVGQARDYFRMVRISFAVVHFNNGMHGWGYSEAEYADGLPSFIAALRRGAPKAKLMWATTTPVRKDAADVGRTNARIDERNHLAAAVMMREHIPSDDQYALMIKHQEMHGDDVHFTKEGSALQAHKVASSLKERLKPIL
jgi:hypothetical protein